ncbi:hypothetical protein [Sulfuriferula nivalis]|uniref:Phage protein n=1 Tax=Sulfuriferula nivalis TaxID=2675298 RepID=A0A809RS21_9PROT|nr:hypothetical protein [Sulfuriferula nivalis]BBP01671.1 hypothetical protein SFSGTM_23790 [Sulfuriferula nivalis]
MEIDWTNIVATLTSAMLGGWIASRIATYQTQATVRSNEQNQKQEVARDLLEAIDSFIHVAYRGESSERQRHSRRIRTLCALVLPSEFEEINNHLKKVEAWHRAESNDRPRGMGISATDKLLSATKQRIFLDVFNQRLDLSNDTDNTNSAT